MRLNEDSRERFADLVEGYIYDFLEKALQEETVPDMATLKQKALDSINEWFFEEEEDTLNEEVLADSIVLEDAVEAVFAELEEACKEECDCGKEDCPICNPKESCKKESDDEDDDKDDSDEDDDEDKDDVDEATLSKHHITKIQSVLDKRKRETDPKYKMSRRRTLMKIAARGGRVINKKLSKGVKKAYRQGFGKRWEDAMDEMEDTLKSEACTKKEACNKESENPEKDDVEGKDVKPKDKAVKKIKSVVKVQKEAMEESVKEALKDIPAFGTLNESESASMTEAFLNLLSKHIDTATDTITEAVLEEMDEYQKTEVIPELREKANEYMVEEVIPSIEKDINDYLNYVVNEKIDEIMESGKIYKSRESLQLESFRDKLIDLIESDLQIMPEQEDALIAMESKCDSLAKSLQEARVEKIKAKNRTLQLENELWISKNMPSDLSEAASEKLHELLESIESNTHEEFVTKATKLIEESTTKKTITEEVKPEQKEQPKEENDIVARTLKFMQR